MRACLAEEGKNNEDALLYLYFNCGKIIYVSGKERPPLDSVAIDRAAADNTLYLRFGNVCFICIYAIQ